jgi:DNA polymerase
MMIVGMCPSQDDDRVGAPFVGTTGRLLNKTLAELFHPQVYITNLLKCYVKPGVKLKQEWVDKCIPYLEHQVKIIKPVIIVTLGADVTFALMSTTRKYMREVRGKVWNLTGGFRIVPTYHPSWVLNRGGYGSAAWKLMRNDIQLATEKMVELIKWE